MLLGDKPPLTDDDPDDLHAAFAPLSEPLLPAAVEPKWKVWKKRELRKPEAWNHPLAPPG
jgi:hypothetical protein